MTDPGVYGPIKTICGSDYYIGKSKVFISNFWVLEKNQHLHFRGPGNPLRIRAARTRWSWSQWLTMMRSNASENFWLLVWKKGLHLNYMHERKFQQLLKLGNRVHSGWEALTKRAQWILPGAVQPIKNLSRPGIKKQWEWTTARAAAASH